MVVVCNACNKQSVFGKDPREYSVMTKEFIKDADGNVKGLITVNVEMGPKGIQVIPGTEKEWPADLVILAMGFLNPEQTLIKSLGLNIDQRNNIMAIYGDYRTSVDGVFAAGDCRRGQSLVVWAISEGRGVADAVNRYLAEKANNYEEEPFLGAM